MAPLAAAADAVHQRGALAGVELWYGKAHAANWMTRLALIVQSALYQLPTTARAKDLLDIREFRRWQWEAAVRAKRAGYDIVYVYAGHD